MKKNLGVVICIFAISFFCMFYTRSAHALLEEDKYTMSEKVGFAFSKLAGTTPRYEEWVKYSKAYADTPEADRALMMQGQTYRLEKGFNLFNLDEDLVKISVLAHIYKINNGQGMLSKPENGYKTVVIKVNNSKNAYFGINIGNHWIAVIPSDARFFEPLRFTDKTYELLKKYGTSENASWIVRLDIWMRPEKIDRTKPMMLEKKPMWLMMGKIANIELWDEERKNIIWNYSAPWYTSDRAKELLDIYQSNDEKAYVAPSK